MAPNNQKIRTDDIDLGEIIRKFWKEKFLILSISLIVSVLAFIHVILKPKVFQTTVVLRNLPSTSFIKFSATGKFNFEKLFASEFDRYLNSFDNLNEFVKQNNSIDSFKTLLKERQISAKDYFLNGSSQNKFGPVTEKNKILENRYYLNFPKELKGDEFLNEYVLFTLQEAENTIKNQIVFVFSSRKNDYEKNLVVAKLLNIQEPILQQKLKDRSLFMINEPKELYYSGTKVIQNEIDTINKLIAEAKEFKLDFNPILDRASKPIRISQSSLKFGILGFIAGLFLSLMYIIVRNALKSSK